MTVTELHVIDAFGGFSVVLDPPCCADAKPHAFAPATRADGALKHPYCTHCGGGLLHAVHETAACLEMGAAA